MVVRVATAILKEQGKEAFPNNLNLARAAIEAMREPTEAMVNSCGNGECAKWAPGAWANYIEAALSHDEVKG
jgi:hypothetical protein